MAEPALLFRPRETDTQNGITRSTLKLLAKALGISETDAIHKALAEYARAKLPQYEADDGPLSEAHHVAIGNVVRKAHGRARIVDSLFDSGSTGGPGGDRKSVRPASHPR